MADGFPGAPAEEHLPRDHDTELGCPSGRSTTAGAVPAMASKAPGRPAHRAPRAGPAAGRIRRTARDAPCRSGWHVAVGRDDHLGIDDAPAVGRVLGDSDGERHAEACGLGRDRWASSSGEAVRVDRVLRPQHEVETASSGSMVAVASRCASVTTGDGTSRRGCPAHPALNGGDRIVSPVALPVGATQPRTTTSRATGRHPSGSPSAPGRNGAAIAGTRGPGRRVRSRAGR